jgi:hypothetical protein
MAFNIGRPAVPEGSPSSVQWLSVPEIKKAVQLCEARGSLLVAIASLAAAEDFTGHAKALNLLFLISK